MFPLVTIGLDANLPRPCPHCFSKQTSDDDFLSLVLKGCFSNHTEDMSNSISDEISIWTSRFEIKKSLISDSVKHVKCDESQQQDSCTFRTHVTTGDDLLMAFSSTIHPDTKLSPQHRSRSMPIQCDTKPKLPENQNCSVRNNNDDTLVRCSSSPVVSETKDTTSESSRNGSIVKPSIRTIPVSQNRTNQSSHSLARNRRPKSYKIAVSTGGYNSGKGENTLVNVIETPETNM